MKNVNMTLNDKGIVAVITLVMILTLLLGGVCGFGLKSITTKSDAQEFTVEQAQLLVDMQAKENEDGHGRFVYGKFDAEGKFWVCYDGSNDNWPADKLTAFKN